VDFDMRHPSLNQVFGVDIEPGFSEVVRGECELEDAMKEVSNRLSFLSAGTWDRSVMASMTGGAAEQILRELRAEYDFVIIDSSPILPVADTRFVSQHVDLVIMSVLRDQSCAPKIEAACEILAAFGAKRVETVVIGPGESRYEHYYYTEVAST
ncbi:MAG: hypothetical protein U1E05_12415, partial [Patescibacteria group bacterium]|nr:hypothetical protein [Patescibacteria group bacterium]